MKIRSRIFLVFVVLMALGIFSLVRWLQGEMRPRYLEAQEDTLVDISQLLASIVSEQVVRGEEGVIRIDTEILESGLSALAKRKIDAQIYEIEKQHVDIRIYVTDRIGKVIFDSDDGRDLNADYSQWRDVYRTLKGEYGARNTHFDPLYPDGSIMYIAAPILVDDEIIGVISVGKPTRNAERFMEHLLSNINTVGFIILLIAILIGLIIHGWLSLPLARLQQYAMAITQGKRATLPELGNNEVGQVGEAIESMRIALEGKSYVSDYVQSLTHELKSPIAAIRGAAELITEDMPAQDRAHFLTNIKSEGQRMQELIDRLLELASLEYRPSLEKVDTVNINDLLEEVIESLKPVAQARSIDIQFKSEKPCSIKGDQFLLSKALTNVLKNAIEFSPDAGQISVHAYTANERLIVQICDQGKGIPDYAKERVFERFFSLARPDGRKGSGLGLSFVKEIVALHQAKVEIADNIDMPGPTGTCVKLVFICL
jgi:two-component system sensor histidine kinase CreC